MSVCTLTCRTCGTMYDLSPGENHKPCPACGAENCRPQAEADVGDILRRATGQRLRCDFKHAEASYQFVLNTSPDEHEALWGLVQCRYAVEYVKDPRTGKPMPIVHAVRTRPMLTDPDFREACDLAPEAVRAQYRQEAEYIDNAMARIRELAAKGDAYDVFLCHKTTRTDGEEGYTEDFKRATQLYMKLEKAGHRVFFAPFAGLTAGDNYEAGIYHAIDTAKVMLVICSNQDYINSPWVRTEWQRFLEMSYEPGADKHLIPLLYEGFPPRRLPDDFRQLQAIAMGELDATETLMAAVAKHVGKATAVGTVPAPVLEPVPKPVQPAPKPVQPAPVYAPESDFKTEAVDGGVAITGYTGPGGEVLIPPTIGGKRVVEIGESAFENCRLLTGVVIPEGVRCIGMMAFSDCTSLTEVVIPGSVQRILFGAFSGCTGLTSVTLPEGLIYLSDEVFDGCEKLVDVNLPGSVTDVRWNPFTACPSLRTIRVATDNPRYSMRDGVLVSREGMLHCYPAGLRAAHYDVPAHVGSIALGAFKGCDILQTVYIPETVTRVEEHAFGEETGVTLRVHEGSAAHTWAQESSVAFEVLVSYAPESHFKTQKVDGGVAITGYTGPGGEVLIPPTIGGKQVAAIGCIAFKNQEKVTGVVIPHGVRRIEDCAFEGCRELKNVDIPESVTSIEWGAFRDCRSLASVRIPAGVTSIEDMMFRGCSGLASVQIPMGVTSIGENAFAYCRLLWDITIPESVTSIGESAFDDCSNLVELNIPAGVTHIGAGAFAQCKKLMSVRIPAGVTSIGEKAFWWCSSLTNVSIPAGVTSIGECAFSGCDMLTSVSLPASVTSIGEYAFHDCEKLASVQIPPSVQDIGTGAFQGCPNLTLRVHPNTVAYVYARKNDLRFELIQKLLPPEPVQFRNEPAPSPAQPTPKPTLLSRLFGKK